VQASSRNIVLVGPFGLAPKATTSTRALPLAEALVARGHRVTLLIPPWDDPARSGQTWDERGVTVRHISLPSRWETVGIAFRLRMAIRAAAPDLVHLFKPKGHGPLSLLGLETRYPLVIDTDDWEGPGGWNDSGIYSRAQQAFFAWQERSTPRHAAAATAASRTLETQLGGFGLPRDHVTYLPNGITTRRHGNWATETQRAAQVRQRLGLGDAPTILLYTRFVEFAPDRPVAILRAVRERVPDARLLIVGHGFKEEERVTFAAAREAGLADAITHLPWVEWDELPATLAAGDVAILPYEDTLINRAKCSIKTLDLMAAARPIVADAVGQNREYLEHGASGIIVPADDPAAFAPAVAELLQDRGRRRAIGAAAAARAWQDFGWERLVARAEQAYEQAIEHGRRIVLGRRRART
jgi:glycosyltransferase involved in cell wall biosynthesis